MFTRDRNDDSSETAAGGLLSFIIIPMTDEASMVSGNASDDRSRHRLESLLAVPAGHCIGTHPCTIAGCSSCRKKIRYLMAVLFSDSDGNARTAGNVVGTTRSSRHGRLQGDLLSGWKSVKQ